MPHLKLPRILGNADGHDAPLTPRNAQTRQLSARHPVVSRALSGLRAPTLAPSLRRRVTAACLIIPQVRLKHLEQGPEHAVTDPVIIVVDVARAQEHGRTPILVPELGLQALPGRRRPAGLPRPAHPEAVALSMKARSRGVQPPALRVTATSTPVSWRRVTGSRCETRSSRAGAPRQGRVACVDSLRAWLPWLDHCDASLGATGAREVTKSRTLPTPPARRHRVLAPSLPISRSRA